MKLSTALQQEVDESQSTMQVLQEALTANFRELEEVKIEKEQITAELNQTKAENSKSTS